jgi:hypothetical protein
MTVGDPHSQDVPAIAIAALIERHLHGTKTKRRATRGTTFGTTFEVHKCLRLRNLRHTAERHALARQSRNQN